MLLFLFLEGREARGPSGGYGSSGCGLARAAPGSPWWQVLPTCGAFAVIQPPISNSGSSSVAPGVGAFSYVLVSFPSRAVSYVRLAASIHLLALGMIVAVVKNYHLLGTYSVLGRWGNALSSHLRLRNDSLIICILGMRKLRCRDMD